jgi:hypothetical protein
MNNGYNPVSRKQMDSIFGYRANKRATGRNGLTGEIPSESLLPGHRAPASFGFFRSCFIRKSYYLNGSKTEGQVPGRTGDIETYERFPRGNRIRSWQPLPLNTQNE